MIWRKHFPGKRKDMYKGFQEGTNLDRLGSKKNVSEVGQ